jgi:hypothetical protein
MLKTTTLLLLLVLTATIFEAACNQSKNIWSAQAKSPDGKVVANGQAVVRNRGLSIISIVETNVYVQWAGDERSQMLVLNLADGSDAPPDTTVDMRWLGPRHLELTYRGPRAVGFQAVKWAGVDISVRDLTEQEQGTGAAKRKDGSGVTQAPPPFAYQKTESPSSH